jgi:RHS repeat-associated protein
MPETYNGTTKTYTYDNTDQLTADGTTTLTYDANGNRTNTGYSTGTGNQLLSDGTWNYTYDNEGNETKKTNIASGYYWKYSYDNLNHLTEADYYSNTNVLQKSVVFKYDAFGNRIEEDVTTTSTVTTRFALDGWNPAKGDAIGTENFDVWADMDGSNHLTMRYVRGDAVDQIFAREDSGGTVAWYLLDRLGSVRDMTDSNGAQKDHIDYDGWGNVINETSPTFSDRYKWTGREYDAATGLQYNRARFYDPTAGRWISQDPLGFDAGDNNLYRYTKNESVSGTDSSGLFGRFRGGPILRFPRFPVRRGPSWGCPCPPETTNPSPGGSIDGNAQKSDITISTYRGPVYGKWGTYVWGVNFTLKRPADSEDGGWVVQHVIKSKTIVGQEANRLDYWEAWRVFPGDTDVPKGALPPPMLPGLLTAAQ